jgi:hypothetical protein
MTTTLTRSKPQPTHRPTPIERSLYLIALDLDPRLNYTHYEIQGAWRRRMARVHPDRGGNEIVAATMNTAYVALVSQPEPFQHVDLTL